MEEALVLGQRIAFARRGDGLPFIFLHGLGADSRQSMTALSGISAADLICPDMPGHGQSASGEWGYERFTQIITALIDHLGIERALFGGISMGSALSLRMALTAPDRVAGLVLVRPSWIARPALPHLGIVARVGRWLEEAPITAVAARLEIDREFIEISRTNQPAADSIRGLINRPDARDTAGVLHAMVHDKPFAHLRDLERVDCPALVLANEGDPLHPIAIAHHLYGRLPNAEYRQLPSRYLAPADHFKALTSAITTFLQSEEMSSCSQPAPRQKRSLPG